MLSNTSYCNVNGEKDASIKITYENGLVGISDITKRVKCTLYFDKYSAIDTIIGNTKGIEEKTEFTGIATESDTGIYTAPDDYGTSYYFRGLEGSLNNWVKFAGFYWRIIRVNGNGTVRIIYSGIANGNVSSSNKTGETTQIGTSMYNHTYNDNAYVGYMMGIPLNGTAQIANQTSSHSNSYDSAHTNTYDSDAKKALDSWYQNNIANNIEYSKYVDVNAGFCNDRQTRSGVSSNHGTLGYGENATSYSPWGRQYENNVLASTRTPTLQCEIKLRDLFTVNNSNVENKGNKKLTYPVGMITMDEALFAGGFYGKTNSTYYLYTNENYWTMSPARYLSSVASVFIMVSDSRLEMDNVHFSSVGLRPVINLRVDTKFTYNNETTKGSETDPYIVV